MRIDKILCMPENKRVVNLEFTIPINADIEERAHGKRMKCKRFVPRGNFSGYEFKTVVIATGACGGLNSKVDSLYETMEGAS